MAPYVVFVGLNGGWMAYLRAGLAFSVQEAKRQPHVLPAWFGAGDPWQAALFYGLHAIPLVATVVAWLRRRRAGEDLAIVLPMAAMAVAMNYSLLRDPLLLRLPDAIVPAVVLGAWLCRCATQAGRPVPAIAIAAVGAVCFSASVARVGEVTEAYRQSGLYKDLDVPTLLGRTASLLGQRRPERLLPSRFALNLRPFFEYLDRCTAPDDRLIIGGYLVEVPFFAERRFAGGQPYFGGSFAGSPDTEARILMRLSRQTVPFALFPTAAVDDFEREFPVVARYLRERYIPLSTVKVTDESNVQILVDRQQRAASADDATGWPCFSPQH
jgi:hypothetical protein